MSRERFQFSFLLVSFHFLLWKSARQSGHHRPLRPPSKIRRSILSLSKSNQEKKFKENLAIVSEGQIYFFSIQETEIKCLLI
jgi:hypothetical protein